MVFEEVSRNKFKVVNSIVSGSPSFVGGWLSFLPVGSEIFFDNVVLSNKFVAGGIWTSGGVPFNYELVRMDGSILDVDRYLLQISGGFLFRSKKIDKNFLEHHSLGLPSWYP